MNHSRTVCTRLPDDVVEAYKHAFAGSGKAWMELTVEIEGEDARRSVSKKRLSR